jgi:uncharacterized protein
MAAKKTTKSASTKKPVSGGKKAKTAKAAAPKKAARPAAPKKAATPRAAKKSERARVHEVVHWEIQAQNPGLLQDFYARALGWKIDANNPMAYGMVSSAGREGIDGGIGGSPVPGSRLVVYASVSSIPDVLARIESLGGKTIMPRTDIGPVVMGLYLDPEGNTMGLLED